MTLVTVVAEETRQVDATVAGGRVLIDPERLLDALGWELKPEGLCRDEVCVPVRDAGALHVDGRLDLAAVAAVLGRASVVEAEAGIVALALPAEERRRALDGLDAPPFSLPDLDGVSHSLDEWRGRKKLLVAFA